ncbi:MAG: hypothetical protein ABW189_05935 [Rickettsiales bacterium]
MPKNASKLNRYRLLRFFRRIGTSFSLIFSLSAYKKNFRINKNFGALIGRMHFLNHRPAWPERPKSAITKMGAEMTGIHILIKIIAYLMNDIIIKVISDPILKSEYFYIARYALLQLAALSLI